MMFDVVRMGGKRAGRARVVPRAPARSRFEVADQREVPHRRHRTALDQRDAAVLGGPVDEARPRKFRPPAEPARDRRKRELEELARARSRRRCG